MSIRRPPLCFAVIKRKRLNESPATNNNNEPEGLTNVVKRSQSYYTLSEFRNVCTYLYTAYKTKKIERKKANRISRCQPPWNTITWRARARSNTRRAHSTYTLSQQIMQNAILKCMNICVSDANDYNAVYVYARMKRSKTYRTRTGLDLRYLIIGGKTTIFRYIGRDEYPDIVYTVRRCRTHAHGPDN